MEGGGVEAAPSEQDPPVRSLARLFLFTQDVGSQLLIPRRRDAGVRTAAARRPAWKRSHPYPPPPGASRPQPVELKRGRETQAEDEAEEAGPRSAPEAGAPASNTRQARRRPRPSVPARLIALPGKR